MESLPLVFSTGWASGINTYLVVLVMGVADRIGNTAEIPDVMQRWDVLAAAGFMYAMEFVADKIPYIDSTWDAASTLIRPTAGAVIGILMAGDADTLTQAVLGAVGGGTALLAHTIKAGTRLAVNTSPEPASNITLSVAEDFAVLGVVWFALAYPVAAAVIAGVLLVGGLLVLYVAAGLVRRGWAAWQERRSVRTAT